MAMVCVQPLEHPPIYIMYTSVLTAVFLDPAPLPSKGLALLTRLSRCPIEPVFSRILDSKLGRLAFTGTRCLSTGSIDPVHIPHVPNRPIDVAIILPRRRSCTVRELTHGRPRGCIHTGLDLDPDLAKVPILLRVDRELHRGRVTVVQVPNDKAPVVVIQQGGDGGRGSSDVGRKGEL